MDSDCSATANGQTTDVVCTESVSAGASGFGQSTSSTTSYTSTYVDATYTQLYLTGGLEKATAIPEAKPQSEDQPGAASNLKGNGLLGVAGALVAAALAL